MPFVAPFPWFGGKRRVAGVVWRAFGDVPNYVEPFFGSGAVLLGRPDWSTDKSLTETVNDLDGFIANAWRAIKCAPDEVTHWADWPSNENDLHARHTWLKARRESLSRRLEGDPDYYDAKIAGCWLWGMAQWIGGGFCGENNDGPWVLSEDEEGVPVLVHRSTLEDGADAGVGVSRQLVHLRAGMGVARKLVHLGNAGRGEPGTGECGLTAWMDALSERLRRVRVCSGDWSRVCGPSPTYKHGLTGVFLDPPYSAEAGRDGNLYAMEDLSVAHDVREWAIADGDNPLMRIALCGYDTEHAMPATWTRYAWKAHGGMAHLGNGNGKANAHREVIWFSPHCLPLNGNHAPSLFDGWHEVDDEE